MGPPIFRQGGNSGRRFCGYRRKPAVKDSVPKTLFISMFLFPSVKGATLIYFRCRRWTLCAECENNRKGVIDYDI